MPFPHWSLGSSSEVESTDGAGQLNTRAKVCMCASVCVCVCSLPEWSNDGVFRASEELCECVCVRVCVAWKRYQRLSSEPHSCINIHQVTFQTESHSFLSTVQGTNKNRQKTTRSLLTVQTALGLTEEGAARPRSDVYAPIWRKCVFSASASLLSCADGAYIRARELVCCPHRKW